MDQVTGIGVALAALRDNGAAHGGSLLKSALPDAPTVVTGPDLGDRWREWIARRRIGREATRMGG